MTTQPDAGKAPAEPIDRDLLLDAEDRVGDAIDIAELIRMAHHRPQGAEDKAVAAGAYAILTALEEAQAMMRRARGVAA